MGGVLILDRFMVLTGVRAILGRKIDVGILAYCLSTGILGV